jgi:hypothetical protein
MISHAATEIYRRVLEYAVSDHPGRLVLVSETECVPRLAAREYIEAAFAAEIGLGLLHETAMLEWWKATDVHSTLAPLRLDDVILVAREELRAMFVVSPDWGLFNRHYPESNLIILSNVGFSSDGKSAVVGASYSWAAFGGNWESLFTFAVINQEWVLTNVRVILPLQEPNKEWEWVPR